MTANAVRLACEACAAHSGKSAVSSARCTNTTIAAVSISFSNTQLPTIAETGSVLRHDMSNGRTGSPMRNGRTLIIM
jgi:hypothetical protein